MNIVQPVDDKEIEIDLVNPEEVMTEERVRAIADEEIDKIEVPTARDINDIWGIIDVSGTATLKVIVLINNGATPANGVTVRAKYTLDVEGTEIKEAVTDAFGIATISGIREGEWVVMVDTTNPVIVDRTVVSGASQATVTVSELPDTSNVYTVVYS